MESFSEELRAEAKPIWDRIFQQPFLWEIKDGTLPLAKFQYYLAQDYLYLEGFARTVALALAKAEAKTSFFSVTCKHLSGPVPCVGLGTPVAVLVGTDPQGR